MTATKVGFFPGCSLEGSSREYNESLQAVAPLLDIELVEVPDWNCCGASAAHSLNPKLALALPARTLALAEISGDKTGAQLLEVVIRATPLTEITVQGLARFGTAQSHTDGSLILKISDESVLPEIARYLVSQGSGLYELTPRRISLEDLFLEIVGTDGGL